MQIVKVRPSAYDRIYAFPLGQKLTLSLKDGYYWLAEPNVPILNIDKTWAVGRTFAEFLRQFDIVRDKKLNLPEWF